MVNKLSTATRLYTDMIVRSANVLTKQGFTKAAGYLHSVAQAIPNPIEAKGPLDYSGVPGNIPGEGPGMTPTGNTPIDTAPPTDPTAAGPVPAAPGLDAGKQMGQPGDHDVAPPPFKEEPVSEGMKEFLDGLEFGNDTFEDISEGDDDGLELHEADDLIVSAQAAKVPEEPTLDIAEDQVTPPGKEMNKMMNAALSGLTLEDVVAELEAVANIFKIREIARRLSLVDMGLNQLGMASLFPSMAEAINKSLESNQYISTRIEDILARLRGALKGKEIDLAQQGGGNPQSDAARQQIEDENKKEQDRKKMRKDLENQALNPEKETPNIDVAQEMAPAPKAAPPLPTANPTR